MSLRRSGNRATTVFEREERRSVAMALRSRNYTSAMIKAELDERAEAEGKPYLSVTARQVRSDLVAGMDALREATVEAAEKLRETLAAKVFDVERLAIATVRRATARGKDETLLRALDVRLRCVRRLSKLYGCDAPAQLEVSRPDRQLKVVFASAADVDAEYERAEDVPDYEPAPGALSESLPGA